MQTDTDTVGLVQLAEAFSQHATWMALTGAGISTASGIPDYRDAQGAWKRQPPIYFQPFMQSASMRARYWARSMVGWRFFGRAAPNAAHHHLARLQAQGRVPLIVTQNVDGLHQQAGSAAVLDLHGRLDQVRCMACAHRLSRADYQTMLESLNPDWLAHNATVAPDGDADLAVEDFTRFATPPCPVCGGICKPDVVFYGENVPPERHAQATEALHAADGLLVLGTSLMVQSSYRYAQLAARLAKPILIANQGVTRGDDLASLHVHASVEAALAVLEPI